MSQNNILDYKPEFKYNASEWADLGTGKYLDAYFEPLLENAAPEYDVQIKYNINQKSLMMVYNPYPMDIWQGFNAGNGDGYLVFDISRRDCVRVKTLVASDMWTENQDGSLTNYYLFNEEGYRYDILGQSVDEIMEEYESIFADVSNVNGNDVFLENIVFGVSGNPAGLYNWVDGNNESIPFNTGLITLPNGWETGVEGIVVDDNAPVKYYNLQGMEVLNPEAGSIVIEKKGNKAVKRIVK